MNVQKKRRIWQDNYSINLHFNTPDLFFAGLTATTVFADTSFVTTAPAASIG